MDRAETKQVRDGGRPCRLRRGRRRAPQRLDRHRPRQPWSCARRLGARGSLEAERRLAQARIREPAGMASSHARPVAPSIARPQQAPSQRWCTTRSPSVAPASPMSAAIRDRAPRPTRPSGRRSRTPGGRAAAARSGWRADPARSRHRSTRCRPAPARARQPGRPATAWPASARRASTVATIDFVRDPTAKRVPGVTGSRSRTSATPWQATDTVPLRRMPSAAPGTEWRPAWSPSKAASSPSSTTTIVSPRAARGRVTAPAH